MLITALDQFVDAGLSTRAEIMRRAIATVLRRRRIQDPHVQHVSKKEVVALHPSLRLGRNRAQGDLEKSGYITFDRINGPRSRGTGLWYITAKGEALFASTDPL